MKEYKGYGGGKVVVDDNSVFLKEMFIKETCPYSDIVSVEITYPEGMKNGHLNVLTKKHCHTIFFLNGSKNIFEELYQFLQDKIAKFQPEPQIINDSKSDNNAVKNSFKFCPECGAKVEGMKFCAGCGYSLTRPVTQEAPTPVEPSITTSSYVGPKCPKCNGVNITYQVIQDSIKTTKKKNSVVRGAARGSAILATGGLWALTPKHDGKEKSKMSLQKIAICQDCGNSWNVK